MRYSNKGDPGMDFVHISTAGKDAARVYRGRLVLPKYDDSDSPIRCNSYRAGLKGEPQMISKQFAGGSASQIADSHDMNKIELFNNPHNVYSMICQATCTDGRFCATSHLA